MLGVEMYGGIQQSIFSNIKKIGTFLYLNKYRFSCFKFELGLWYDITIPWKFIQKVQLFAAQ